jgi:hypothetical protein
VEKTNWATNETEAWVQNAEEQIADGRHHSAVALLALLYVLTLSSFRSGRGSVLEQADGHADG